MFFFCFTVAEANPILRDVGGDVKDTKMPSVEVEVQPEVHTNLVPNALWRWLLCRQRRFHLGLEGIVPMVGVMTLHVLAKATSTPTGRNIWGGRGPWSRWLEIYSNT